MPAASFISAPKDAPADLQVSGKFTGGARAEKIGSVEGLSAGRPTGISLPFKGQPLQGHSGIKHMSDGTYWILTDNGAGSKANSPDFALYLSHYKVDFKSGEFNRLETVFLHDPDKKVPFRIVHEGTPQRYLTGSDFDTESFQFAGDALWIGDELGPFLIKCDLKGNVLEANHHAIGDFNMIDETTGLIIERDNGEGTTDKACPAGQKRTDCFHDLAKFKRVYKVEMTGANVGAPMRKVGFIDLMNIADPNKLSRKPPDQRRVDVPVLHH